MMVGDSDTTVAKLNEAILLAERWKGVENKSLDPNETKMICDKLLDNPVLDFGLVKQCEECRLEPKKKRGYEMMKCSVSVENLCDLECRDSRNRNQTKDGG